MTTATATDALRSKVMRIPRLSHDRHTSEEDRPPSDAPLGVTRSGLTRIDDLVIIIIDDKPLALPPRQAVVRDELECVPKEVDTSKTRVR
jgi:hypothetical protein